MMVNLAVAGVFVALDAINFASYFTKCGKKIEFKPSNQSIYSKPTMKIKCLKQRNSVSCKCNFQ